MANYKNTFGPLHLLLVSFAAGCASNYQIVSTPSGASVYFEDPVQHRQVYIGATPLNYSKSSLPQTQTFQLSFQKDGFKTELVPLAATDEAKTVISVFLKPEDPINVRNSDEINKSISLLFEAQKLIYQHRFHAAIVEIDKILKTKPTLVEGHVMRGTAYYLLGEMPSAIESWKAALALSPDNAEVHRFLDEKGIRIPASETKPEAKKVQP